MKQTVLKTRLARKMLRYTSMSQLNINWEGWSAESVAVHYKAPMTRIAVETSAKPAVPAKVDAILADFAKSKLETEAAKPTQ